MGLSVKICGLTTEEAVTASIKGGAEYLGFIFFPPSPRYVTPARAEELSAVVPETIRKVAVLVNATDKELDVLLKTFKPDMLQFHGKEPPERIYDVHLRYALPVMKAIPVRSSDDIARGAAYADVADILLFDAKAPATSTLPGGNGVSFDWSLMKLHKPTIPWFLSGGLNLENLEEAVETSGARAVDVSSSLESEPGVKDPELIELFLKKAAEL